MTIAAALGWLAAAHISMLALPAKHLEDFNTAFAVRVDAGESCWKRIAGEVGSYGATISAPAGPKVLQETSPAHNYTLSIPCIAPMVATDG